MDEADVFLHPPQARLLGYTLARHRPTNQQLFVATHSADFVRGALEAEPAHVRILRVRRSHGGAKVATVSSDRIAQLWRDPGLRYSNLLDALFHDAAILCEADADCKFYQWIAGDTENAADVMYLPTGGRGRLGPAMAALRALGLPCIAVADMDLLSSERDLGNLVRAAGAKWETIRPRWTALRDLVARRSHMPTIQEVRSDVTELFKANDGSHLTDATVERVRLAVRAKSGWAAVKRNGLRGFGPGEEFSLAESIVSECAEYGILLVPEGELEGFDRTIGAHGPTWLLKVLEARRADGPELQAARDFVLRIVLAVEKVVANSAALAGVDAAGGERQQRPASTRRAAGNASERTSGELDDDTPQQDEHASRRKTVSSVPSPAAIESPVRERHASIAVVPRAATRSRATGLRVPRARAIGARARWVAAVVAVLLALVVLVGFLRNR